MGDELLLDPMREDVGQAGLLRLLFLADDDGLIPAGPDPWSALAPAQGAAGAERAEEGATTHAYRYLFLFGMLIPDWKTLVGSSWILRSISRSRLIP